jgi:hypothetical protein
MISCFWSVWPKFSAHKLLACVCRDWIGEKICVNNARDSAVYAPTFQGRCPSV